MGASPQTPNQPLPKKKGKPVGFPKIKQTVKHLFNSLSKSILLNR